MSTRRSGTVYISQETRRPSTGHRSSSGSSGSYRTQYSYAPSSYQYQPSSVSSHYTPSNFRSRSSSPSQHNSVVYGNPAFLAPPPFSSPRSSNYLYDTMSASTSRSGSPASVGRSSDSDSTYRNGESQNGNGGVAREIKRTPVATGGRSSGGPPINHHGYEAVTREHSNGRVVQVNNIGLPFYDEFRKPYEQR